MQIYSFFMPLHHDEKSISFFPSDHNKVCRASLLRRAYELYKPRTGDIEHGADFILLSFGNYA